MENLNALSEVVIGAAIEVHRTLGPGFLEGVYELALIRELQDLGIPFARQVMVPITYKGDPVGDARLDILVDRKLVLELKSVDALNPIHQAQLLSYLRATGLTLGLLINFNVPNLTRGLKRISNNHPS